MAGGVFREQVTCARSAGLKMARVSSQGQCGLRGSVA